MAALLPPRVAAMRRHFEKVHFLSYAYSLATTIFVCLATTIFYYLATTFFIIKDKVDTVFFIYVGQRRHNFIYLRKSRHTFYLRKTM